MTNQQTVLSILRSSLELPCGVVLKNRLVKSAMSDSLGDGAGDSTPEQAQLYQRWAQGGVALSVVGEVQVSPNFAEKPGNLVLTKSTNQSAMQALVRGATTNGTQLWAQLGHAGALSHLAISQPQGPSALNIPGLQCEAMSAKTVKELPELFAQAAMRAKAFGFSGVQIHAGHGFLLSQFLSPLFNHRSDGYGGSLEARARIVLAIISAVRAAVGPLFPIGIRINSTDQIEGGLTNADSLELVSILDETSIDLIDISGGTYFPGAKASSDGITSGPYFLDFARQAKKITNVPLMLTGGFKARTQALDALTTGAADMVGLARAMVINSDVAHAWLSDDGGDPLFPKFDSNPPGGITAWYTMRLSALSENRESAFKLDLPTALRLYEERDAERCIRWREKFFA